MNIRVDKLSKHYRQKKALNEVSFQIDEPKIYGLLGRNGAGKTTFMEILAGHQLPTSGEIYVNSEIPFDNRSILEHICLIKEGNNFNRELKVKHVLKTNSLFYLNCDEALANTLVQEYKLPIQANVKALSIAMVSAIGVIVDLQRNAHRSLFDYPYIEL